MRIRHVYSAYIAVQLKHELGHRLHSIYHQYSLKGLFSFSTYSPFEGNYCIVLFYFYLYTFILLHLSFFWDPFSIMFFLFSPLILLAMALLLPATLFKDGLSVYATFEKMSIFHL